MRLFYNSLWKPRWNRISKLKIIFETESEVAQSCLTLCNPMDCSLPGFSIHGIFQERVLKWVAISFSRRSSWPKDWTWVSCIVGRCFTSWATIIFNSNIKFKLLGEECLSKVILVKVDNVIKRLPCPNNLKANASKSSNTRLSQGCKNCSRF